MVMKIKFGRLRHIIREALSQHVNEMDDLDEADADYLTDPSNNPGRPDDAFEYLGMHPSPTAAMSHPFAGGGGGGGEGGDAESGATPATPPDAPSEDGEINL